MRELVSINGEIFAPENAKISVFDRGFLYGDGIYEVARSYGRILFELERHTDRLFNSAAKMSLDIGMTKRQVMEAMYKTYEASNRDDAYVRIIITRGEGKLSLDTKAATKPNVVIIVKDIAAVPAEKYETGVGVAISGVLRNSKKALDPNIKSGNYLNNILAFMDTQKFAAFEAIMVSKDGYLTEGTTSNFYIVEKGVVHTAPLGADILSGITRAVIVEICKKTGIGFQETLILPERAFKADESFISGSVREILPVTAIDGKAVGQGKVGPVAKKLREEYQKVIQQYCEARKQKKFID